MREKVLGIALFTVVLFFYVFFAGRGEFKFPTHWANYLSHLSLSIMNGRLDLIGTYLHDLSQFKSVFVLINGENSLSSTKPIVFLNPLYFSSSRMLGAN